MRLLIITQKVDQDDPVLGFFHRWIEEFSKNVEQISVICLYEGKHKFPSNVRVYSLGKEFRVSRLMYIIRFYKILWRLRGSYDAVFVHMNPIYVILCGVLWRGFGKKVALWYTHKHVDSNLRIAEALVHIIFTASQKSFRLKSDKIVVVGHGIDTEEFAPRKKEHTDIFQIVSVGRISPIKDYETLIRAIDVLVRGKIHVRMIIMGDVVLESDRAYLFRLNSLIEEKHLGDVITLLGSVPHKQLPDKFAQADLLVSASGTGSIDKAILEAMACGIPAVTSNEAFGEVFGVDAVALMFPSRDTSLLVQRIKHMYNLGVPARAELGKRLREIVVTNHNIENVISKILKSYETSR
jgi:glycosyltransferase involved in cell wall biosynthesis